MAKKVWLLIIGSLVVLLGLVGSCGSSVMGVAKGILNNNLGEHKLFNWCTSGLIDINKLLDNKTYYVMLQNNTELRATGGFMGSYVRIKTEKSGIDENFAKRLC